MKFEHLHITTPDPERTANWYREMLGATLASKTVMADGRTNYHLDLHGLRLNVTGLIPGQVAEQRYGVEHLAIVVERFDDELTRFASSGVRKLEDARRPSGRRVALFAGPDGVRVELMEEVAKE